MSSQEIVMSSKVKEDTRGIYVKYGCLIDWQNLRDLEGRLLTYIDATYADKEQREAQKSILKNVLRNWMYENTSRDSVVGNLKVTAKEKFNSVGYWDYVCETPESSGLTPPQNDAVF